MTENHNYNTPAKGTLDWDVPLNTNFESLDTDVEIRDTEANRDDYAPKEGAKYLSTDTGSVYLGDGDAWNELGTLRRVFVSESEPADPVAGDLWIDTS
ncbi:hypothetical protein [Halocalculus aciditolerans]|uniref:Major tropism determinant N-terminal domain-containing protein n=1 Tax=Halocalculus aciditolerans TaxID=1383812 RepID=A0A830F578_9EURY|nr:hypothetical protein GCM10009039_12520 [Halocalculus aciditolerans]